MEKNKKRKILLISLIALIVVLIGGLLILKFCVIDKNITTSINNGTIKDIKHQSFEITDMKYVIDEENQVTTIKMKIKNTSNRTKHLDNFTVVLKDKDGNTIERLYSYIAKDFEKGEEVETSVGMDVIIDNAVKVEFKF